MSLSHAERIAESIILAQEIARLQTAKVQNGFKEMPRTLAYYYRPHQYATVAPGETKIIYDFNVPSNHVFHILQVGNTYFFNTYSIWRVDGVNLERVERIISDINSPLQIGDRQLYAFQNVRWITHNDSDESIISNVLIDGKIYHIDDFKKLLGTIK